jgi:hypothetical protein
MNLKSALIGAVALLALPSAANALVIGSPDAGNCYPFMCNDSGSSVGQSFHYQQVYDGSLFGGGAVQFDTITFFADDGVSGTVLNGNYVISFSSTTDAVGSGYPVTNVANTASFYTGNLGGAIGASFSVTGANYVFNPANGNLLMDIIVSNQDNVSNGTGNSYNKADYTGIQTSRAVDAGAGGIYSGGGGLVTEFNTSPAVPEPASWALMIAGFGMLGTAMRRRRTAATA